MALVLALTLGFACAVNLLLTAFYVQAVPYR